MPKDSRSNKNKDNEQTKKYRPQNRRRKPNRKRINDEQTKRVSTAKKPVPKKGNNKGKNGKKGKKDKFSNRHPKLMMAIKIFIVLFLLLCVICNLFL